ncbi:MAG: sensor histidine kinase [Clostridium sp.]
MNTKRYIYSKLPYLIMNLIIFMFIVVIMKIVDTNLSVIFFIFLIWFMPLVIYLILDFVNKKRFYDNISGILSKLDKKYLLPEVIKKPKFYEGEVLYDILQESNRAMHENVSYYKILQSEYREYIEAWVHEIKTPIALTKLVGENSEGKVKNIITSETKKIEGYVDQVLYYSRSTDVSKDYIVKEFEISEVLKTVIRNNRRDFINKKITIDVDNVSGRVITDSKWVGFIINQIIVNSIKYSKENNTMIRAYTRVQEESIALVIEDNGVGICSNDLPRVFDKGFTGENGRVYGKSTGIGLYLSKKLCNKLGLGITLNSTYGEGTTVKIVFPLGNLTRIK